MALHLSRIDIRNFCYSSKEGKYYSPKKLKIKKGEKRVANFSKERTINYGDNACEITMRGWRHDRGCCS